MLLLVRREHTPGVLEAAEADNADSLEELKSTCRLVVDLSRDPIYVLEDKRRMAVPYIPTHRELEAWLRDLAQAAL